MARQTRNHARCGSAGGVDPVEAKRLKKATVSLALKLEATAALLGHLRQLLCQEQWQAMCDVNRASAVRRQL